MTQEIDAYRPVVGDRTVSTIEEAASDVADMHILNINSTYRGGGVAEILDRLVPLMNDIGVKTGWRVLHGSPDFFKVVKKFHNALQGDDINFTSMKQQVYLETNEAFSTYTHIDHDCVIVHDPQPLPLIQFYEKEQPWIWRFHGDFTQPYMPVWQYLEQFVSEYNRAVVTMDTFKRDSLSIPQDTIMPSIDPVSLKNTELDEVTKDKYLKKYGIDRDKPLVTQVSRFDKWKDPEGVIAVFDTVREEVDCRLVLLGSMALDDPQGPKVYERLVEQVEDRDDIILINDENDILTNILQRESAVIVQKSLREGFALTVSEALWKQTPVIGSQVGGIPLQIADGDNGFLVNPHDHADVAKKIIYLLQNPELRQQMGENGQETVRQHFLITRQLHDWLSLIHQTRQHQS